MINHTRTLLANLDGGGPASGPGEEYTDPAYRAVRLPAYLKAIRAALFGQSPDRRTVLYRTRQYMACLHASRLAGYATAYDPRISYLPFDDGTLSMPPTIVLTPLGHSRTLFVSGQAPAQDASGRTAFAWTISVLS